MRALTLTLVCILGVAATARAGSRPASAQRAFRNESRHALENAGIKAKVGRLVPSSAVRIVVNKPGDVGAAFDAVAAKGDHAVDLGTGVLASTRSPVTFTVGTKKAFRALWLNESDGQ